MSSGTIKIKKPQQNFLIKTNSKMAKLGRCLRLGKAQWSIRWKEKHTHIPLKRKRKISCLNIPYENQQPVQIQLLQYQKGFYWFQPQMRSKERRVGKEC